MFKLTRRPAPPKGFDRDRFASALAELISDCGIPAESQANSTLHKMLLDDLIWYLSHIEKRSD